MSYVPAIWLIVILVRLAIALVRRWQGKPAPVGRAVAPAGLANSVLFIVYFFFVYIPLASLIVVLGAEKLAGWAAAIGIPLLLAAGLYAATVGPHWLAWRVLGPWHAAPLGRLVLALGLRRTRSARLGSRALYDACFGRDWDSRLAAAGPWEVAAAALDAEAHGEPERADRLFGLFERLPPKVRAPRRARAVAAERLAWAAARRGDWPRALARASAGRGRGVALVRRLAAIHLGRPVSRLALLAAWALAPGRTAAIPLLRATLSALAVRPPDPGERLGEPGRPVEPVERPGVPGQPAERPGLPGDAPLRGGRGGREIDLAATADPAIVGPHLAHLRLLARAAAGQRVEARDVLALAGAWSGRLAGAPAAALVQRALELGGQGLSDLAEELRRSVESDLDALAEVAQGEWSTHADDAADAGEAGARLVRGLLDRAHQAVRREVEAYDREEDGGDTRRMAFALEELERWLDLRERVERLVEIGGEQALAIAWHNGLRTTACNWPVVLVEQRGNDALFPATLMHEWSRELAERVGDEAIETLSRSNVKITRSQLG